MGILYLSGTGRVLVIIVVGDSPDTTCGVIVVEDGRTGFGADRPPAVETDIVPTGGFPSMRTDFLAVPTGGLQIDVIVALVDFRICSVVAVLSENFVWDLDCDGFKDGFVVDFKTVFPVDFS